MTTDNPILNPVKKAHTEDQYSESELALANRNCGTLLETLQHDITPVGAHYLLSHFDIPMVANPTDWTLSLSGLFRNKQTLSLADLKSLPAVTRRVTLECAGNGRRLVSPRWPSQPWGTEAVGTADWTGTALHHVLALAGISDDCIELVFHGTDIGIDGGQVHNFARSLPPAMAMHKDVMIAWQMNGQPLAPQHGFPMRMIVSGWYGMASVKWLNEIQAINHKFQGHQQTGTYMYRDKPTDHGEPVTTIRVKSLLVPPGVPDWSTRKRLIKPGPVKIVGKAWGGGGVPVTKVEFGANGIWQDAILQGSDNPYAWVSWHCDWQAEIGAHELSCRATDANGNTQPLTAPWDAAGFGNNAVQKIEAWCDHYQVNDLPPPSS